MVGRHGAYKTPCFTEVESTRQGRGQKEAQVPSLVLGWMIVGLRPTGWGAGFHVRVSPGVDIQEELGSQ